MPIAVERLRGKHQRHHRLGRLQDNVQEVSFHDARTGDCEHDEPCTGGRHARVEEIEGVAV